MIEAAEYMLGSKIPKLNALTASGTESSEKFLQTFQREMNSLDEGQGVLILADVYGTSNTNMVQAFLKKDRIEMIAGVYDPLHPSVLRLINGVIKGWQSRRYTGSDVWRNGWGCALYALVVGNGSQGI